MTPIIPTDDAWFMTMDNHGNQQQATAAVVVSFLTDDAGTNLLTDDAGTNQLTS